LKNVKSSLIKTKKLIQKEKIEKIKKIVKDLE